MAQEQHQVALLELLRCGVKPADIQHQTSTSYSTIRRVRQHQTSKKRGKATPNPVRTPELVVEVRQSLAQNPGHIICGLAHDHGVSERTMQRLVKVVGILCQYQAPQDLCWGQATPPGSCQEAHQSSQEQGLAQNHPVLRWEVVHPGTILKPA